MTISYNSQFCCFSHAYTHASKLRLVNAWIGLCMGLWLVVASLLHSTAFAGTLPLQQQVSSINLEPHASFLLDPSGTLSADAVASPEQSARFTPLRGPLSLGFTEAAVWVRISLTSAESAQWLLEVGQPILEDVRLYTRLQSNEMQRVQGTLSDALLPRQVDYRRPIFKIDLHANTTSVLYLRLNSRTAMVTHLKLWAPSALLESSNHDTFLWGLVFGAYLLVLFFYSAFWVWTREKVHLYYVLYVATNFGAAFLTGHWNDMLGFQIDTHLHTMALGVFICLSLWIGPVFSVSFLGAHRIWPKAVRFYLVSCIIISSVCMVLVLTGRYSQGALTVQLVSMLMIFINTLAAGHLSWKGDKKAQLLLLGFSLFYIGVIWRYMRNIGLIEPTAWNESVYQVGAFVHMMVMSTGIFSSYNALRRQSEKDQARADAQERQRIRQYEFLSMVSHEVRTPLTVISASADNLLLDPSVSTTTRTRVDKIIRHCGKLQHLFDSYLNNERLLNGDMPVKMVSTNLTALCEVTTQDFNDAHGLAVRFETDQVVTLVCNADLLRVAITNLLENARKHAPDRADISLSINCSESMSVICVTDQGDGVDDADMPYIFDAYFRGKGSYASKGSGLGLHLVKFVAEQHKGRAYAVKPITKGMQFVIEIPNNPALSDV